MEDLAAYSDTAIKQGSKSFARAAMLFAPEIRVSVTMLYAWCRYCDDVIDGQTLGHGQQAFGIDEKRARLRMLQDETDRICNGQGSDIPAFAALARVVQRHGIDRRHLFDLLEGFGLDAEEARFRTLDDTLHYCYHVAGVVGVMMAQIMGAKDPDVIHRAADLGIAFQLTNIARDVVEDMQVGRCYLPEQWLARRGIPREDMHLPQHHAALHALACELVELAEQYYASARIGMAQLPWRCAWAIASALLIYRDIGLRVRAAQPAEWVGRMQVPASSKLAHVCRGCFVASAAVARRRRRGAISRAGLWTKADA
jgi:phytoene synthase